MVGLKKYTNQFKKYRNEYFSTLHKYMDDNKLWGMGLTRKSHQKYYTISDLWARRRIRLDAPILRTAKYMKGDILNYIRQDETGVKINCIGEVENIKTCEMGTGDIMYSFKNLTPPYNSTCIFYYDNDHNKLKRVKWNKNN